MSQNEQEIKAKADQAVEMFFKIITASYAENDIAQDIAHILYDREATQCAIIMYEDRVKLMKKSKSGVVRMLKQIGKDYGFSVKFKDGKDLIESKAILTELKSRI